MDFQYATRIILIGIGATMVSDLWGLMRAPLFGVPAPDYAFVGRWLGTSNQGSHMH